MCHILVVRKRSCWEVCSETLWSIPEQLWIWSRTLCLGCSWGGSPSPSRWKPLILSCLTIRGKYSKWFGSPLLAARVGASSMVQAWLVSHLVLEEGGVPFPLRQVPLIRCLQMPLLWPWYQKCALHFWEQIFPKEPKIRINLNKTKLFRRAEANALKSKMNRIKCCLIHHQNPI